MKVYISVDIEGVAGITHWDEAEKTRGVRRETANYLDILRMLNFVT